MALDLVNLVIFSTAMLLTKLRIGRSWLTGWRKIPTTKCADSINKSQVTRHLITGVTFKETSISAFGQGDERVQRDKVVGYLFCTSHVWHLFISVSGAPKQS